MKSSRVLLTIVALVTPAAPIWAQAEILQVIPDDAIGFAVINRVGQTNEKLISLGKRLKAEMQDSPLEKLRSALGGAKGLAENGMGAVAAFEGKGENDKPRPLLYVPVTDYKTFLEPLEPGETKDGITAIKLKMIEKEMFAGKRGNYAVIAHPEDRALLERALKATKTLTTAAEPLAGWLADNDAAGVLTTRGIKLVGAKIRQGLDDGKQQLAILPQEAQQTLVKFLEAAENFFKSAETDVSHAGLAVRLDDKGNLHLNARAQFVSGSGFAKAGGGVKALAGGPVAGLPAGPFVFAMGGALPRDAVKAMSAMNLDIMKAAGQNIPEESLKKLEAVNAQMMEGMKGGAMVWQVGKENQPLFANFVVVTHTENSTAFLSSYEKALTVTNDIMKGLNLPITPTYDVKKVKLGAKDALETSMDFSNLGLPQEVQQIFEKVFGEGGKMTMSIAARDDKTVVLRYTNTAGLKEVLDGGSAQFASDADVAQVTKAFPAGSQWAFYLSPKGTLDFADRTIKAVVPLPLNIPKFPATPPVAVGVRVSAQNFEVHTVIPAGVVDNLAELIEQFKRLLPGGA
jgi:hypothetical protein